ncbi:MAG TPA: inositol monophosphatase family protein [Fibrobacteraceae bacterium]|nr:inositol monophosphatase family protein [Fibrobacteraceae bacterium]
MILPFALLGASAIRAHLDSAANARSKSDRSPVTDADLASHAAIDGALRQQDPRTPVVSEEAPLPECVPDSFYLLDPLDGTSEFIRGSGEFAVSLGKIVGGKAQEGALVAPLLGWVAWGEVDHGAFAVRLDPQLLAVSSWKEALALAETCREQAESLVLAVSPDDWKPSAVLCSYSHKDSATEAHLQSLEPIRRLTVGACLKFLWLAQGKGDYYPRHKSLHEWDIAGGHALLKAAGGNLFRFGTREELTYGNPGFVAPEFEALPFT